MLFVSLVLALWVVALWWRSPLVSWRSPLVAYPSDRDGRALWMQLWSPLVAEPSGGGALWWRSPLVAEPTGGGAL